MLEKKKNDKMELSLLYALVGCSEGKKTPISPCTATWFGEVLFCFGFLVFGTQETKAYNSKPQLLPFLASFIPLLRN